MAFELGREIGQGLGQRQKKGRRKGRGSDELPLNIFLAGVAGDICAVSSWLHSGGDVNAGESVTRGTLLMAAAVSGVDDMAVLLLSRDAKVDLRDSHNQTALMFAAIYGHLAVVRRLIAAGAAVDLVSESGLTAERHACRAGRFECVRELQALLPPNTRAQQASRADRKRLRRAEDSMTLPEDVAAAAERGDICAVQDWLAGGGHVDARHQQADCTLLMCACAEGREGLVALLLRRGASPELDENECADRFTPLMLAARSGYTGIVHRLLLAGAKLGVRLADGTTPLRLAEIHGHAECVRIVKERLGTLAK